MRLTRILNYLLFAAVFFGLSLFCHEKTRGFRLYAILSNLPNELRWEFPPLSVQEEQQIETLLDQTFTFLGSGGWCYAFLGQDQKTVLKFFNHTHLAPSGLLTDFSFKKLVLQSDPYPENQSYFQEFNFNSCKLLYTQAKERTGLLYVHLNKTQGKHKSVTLIDNIGVRHTIDLDKTEFVVQKKAELLFPHFDRLSEDQRLDEAKQCLDDFYDCLLALSKKGIRDNDRSLRNNFGFTDDGAITLDLSSFTADEEMKNPGVYKKEIVNKTQRLSRFLRKHHPELYVHSEMRLAEIMED